MTNRRLVSPKRPPSPHRPSALRGLALAAALTTLACAGASAQPAPVTPSLKGPASKIAGAWRVTQIAGAPVAAGSNAQLEFRGRAYSGSDSCNRISGRLTRVGGGHIRFGMAATTRMACEPTVMAAADAFQAALTATRGYRLAGTTLTFSDARGGVTIVAEKTQ